MKVSNAGTIGDAVKAIINSMLGIAIIVDSNSAYSAHEAAGYLCKKMQIINMLDF